jgi:hypothetical protein
MDINNLLNQLSSKVFMNYIITFKTEFKRLEISEYDSNNFKL